MKPIAVIALISLLSTITAVADTLTGPVTNSANGHVYYLLTQNNWTASQAEAVKLGGNLATIRNSAEQDWVYATFSTFGGTNHNLWIGLADLGRDGVYRWVSGEAVNYTNWASTEPSAGSERYVHMILPGHPTSGMWNNLDDVSSFLDGVLVPLNGVVEIDPATPSCVPVGTSLVTWWAGEGNASDMTGLKPGTIVGNVSFEPGRVRQAFSFNGTEGYVLRTNDVATTKTDGWGLDAWVFWKGLLSLPGKGSQFIIYNGDSGKNGFGLLIPEPAGCNQSVIVCQNIGKLLVLYGGITWVPTGITLATNAWTHIALTRAAGVLALYVNGAPVFSQADSGPNPPSGGYMRVSDGADASFNGLIDEAGFWSDALSSNLVEEIFAAGSSGKCPLIRFSLIERLPSQQYHFILNSATGDVLRIDRTPTLPTWLFLLTVTNVSGTLDITDPTSAGGRARFYRAVRQ